MGRHCAQARKGSSVPPAEDQPEDLIIDCTILSLTPDTEFLWTLFGVPTPPLTLDARIWNVVDGVPTTLLRGFNGIDISLETYLIEDTPTLPGTYRLSVKREGFQAVWSADFVVP